MLSKQSKNKKNFEELIKENKEALLRDKQALEVIERRIERRHELLNKHL